MASNEETNAAGTDTRPPMLVESDYDSWKIRIHRYIRGKPNGKLIWKSIQNGPTPHPMITDPPPTDSTIVPAPRKKLDSEFSEEENKLEMADTQAEIILSQGLPRHIFNNLNQTSTAKEIWDNVEMLMQGSGRTIQQRKEDLFDEYERFRAIGNESIHDYFKDGTSNVGNTGALRYPQGQNCDVENKVRQEQALVIQRNKRNAELVQENELLKSTFSGKEKSIAFLQSEKEKILSEKKELADITIDEIVCLKNANKAARDMLQRFNMPTQTIPMLSKKPKKATADLHKDI
ncbi:hypothetical protein Tco_0366742 [Tanacetum coccineum]